MGIQRFYRNLDEYARLNPLQQQLVDASAPAFHDLDHARTVILEVRKVTDESVLRRMIQRFEDFNLRGLRMSGSGEYVRRDCPVKIRGGVIQRG